MAQWVGLHASTSEGLGLIPGWETKTLQAVRGSQKKKRMFICTIYAVIHEIRGLGDLTVL